MYLWHGDRTQVGLRTRAGLAAPSSLAGAAAAALTAFGSRFTSGTTSETAALAPQPAGGLQSRAAIVAAQKEVGTRRLPQQQPSAVLIA
jgi:hypothetical protein